MKLFFGFIVIIFISRCTDSKIEENHLYESSPTILMNRAATFKIQKNYIISKMHHISVSDSLLIVNLITVLECNERLVEHLINASGGIKMGKSELQEKYIKSQKIYAILKELDYMKNIYGFQKLIETNNLTEVQSNAIRKITRVLKVSLIGKNSTLNNISDYEEVNTSIIINDIISVQNFINSVILLDLIK